MRLRRGTGSEPALFASAAIVLLVIGAFLRVRASLNDLWLDEIWSLQLAGQVGPWWGVLTQIHHDNNHYLNTLWLHAMGPRGNWPGYRLPSIAAGSSTVLLAGLIARRRDAASGVIAMILTAVSYVLVLYSSEARGYASVVFFALLAYALLESLMERPRWPLVPCLWASMTLGFLSHLTFVSFFAAAGAWSAWRLLRAPGTRAAGLRALVLWHSVPAAFFATLYVVDVRHLVIGGRSSTPPVQAMEAVLAWVVGAPPGAVAMAIACVVALAALASGLCMLWRERSDAVVLYAGAIVVAPALLVIAGRAQALFPRYFLIGIAFLLVLSSQVLSALLRRGRLGKVVVVALLAGYVGANAWRLSSLMEHGRGDYQGVVKFLAESTKGDTVTIGGDHDLRIPLVLQFYVPGATGGKAPEYFAAGSWPAEGVEWLITHADPSGPPAPTSPLLVDPAGHRYDLVRTFESAPLSGAHWFVYHEQGR